MNKLLVTSILFLCFGFETIAQISTSSPYSRFGLGDLHQNILPSSIALGGSVTALNDAKIINSSNPATYSAFTPNSFLLTTGGWHQTTNIENTSDQQIANNNAFSHLLVGFPILNGVGLSFGMIPFSSIGYEMSSEIIDNTNELNTGVANYSGDGGISKVYFGGGAELFDGLSIGFNSSYLFGSLNRRKKLDFNDDSFLNSRSNSKIKYTRT